MKDKSAKKRNRRRAYEKKRNIAKLKRRKMRGEGGMNIEFKTPKGFFCSECKHAKRNKKSKEKAYYCDICDLDSYKAGTLRGWGHFEANKHSGCLMFKKRLIKIKTNG